MNVAMTKHTTVHKMLSVWIKSVATFVNVNRDTIVLEKTTTRVLVGFLYTIILY
jgi:hypothetical protein